MNEQISWDQSLVKKYSSSNHFKLLSQLRNEVEKYPLNKKKNIPTEFSNNGKLEVKNNFSRSTSLDTSSNINSNINKENINTESTVSFNNSKNFSIYKNHTKNSTNGQDENKLLDAIDQNEEERFSTFKDRLNQIDMK
tara:strand:+ start:2223 stop:2636 length:414 start_codon:yes stop_codon:yes gene_type:complete